MEIRILGVENGGIERCHECQSKTQQRENGVEKCAPHGGGGSG
jgi:hypothetical protein